MEGRLTILLRKRGGIMGTGSLQHARLELKGSLPGVLPVAGADTCGRTGVRTQERREP
jgi:hypothetical protein